MHIPDNYLSPSTCAVMGVAMLPAWKISIQKVKKELPKEKIAFIGVGAAFSFLGMMFNIPLMGGTTGHAVGGTLIAILAGPYAACISVTMALLVQCFMFGDGGVLAFGANCFNMAFVLPFVGYFVYLQVKKFAKGHFKEQIAAGIGSYVGINAAALCAAVEFGIQPLLFKDTAGNPLYCPYSLSISIPAMMIGHLTLFGVAEVVYTIAILSFMKRVSMQDNYVSTQENKKTNKAVYALLAGLIVCTPIGLLAAGTAWGEWGSTEIATVVSNGNALGFIPNGMAHGFEFQALFSDYALSGIPDWIGYIASAIIGSALVIIVFKVLSTFKKSKVKFDT